jgi:hypothetical protein
MRLKVTIALVILFVGFVSLTTMIPGSSTAQLNTPTATHNLLLGTQLPEDAGRGFPPPLPTLPPPTDLAPDRPASEKFLLVFRTPEGGNITFLAPYEMIEEQVDKIGRDFLVNVIDPYFVMTREPDREFEEVQTAIATLTPATAVPAEVLSTPVPSAP